MTSSEDPRRRKAAYLQADAPFQLPDAAFRLNNAAFRQDDLPCNLPDAAFQVHEPPPGDERPRGDDDDDRR